MKIWVGKHVLMQRQATGSGDLPCHWWSRWSASFSSWFHREKTYTLGRVKKTNTTVVQVQFLLCCNEALENSYRQQSLRLNNFDPYQSSPLFPSVMPSVHVDCSVRKPSANPQPPLSLPAASCNTALFLLLTREILPVLCFIETAEASQKDMEVAPAPYFLLVKYFYVVERFLSPLPILFCKKYFCFFLHL